jgi:diacylglycerol kinase (ATP)
MRILLFHNPGAGIGEHDRRNLIGTLTAAGHEVVYCNAKLHDLAEYLDRGCDVAMSGGGDGTVAELALALEGTGLPLTVLPLGTSNNIAHSLGTAFDAEAFAAGLSSAQRRKMEIGNVEGLGKKPERFVEAVGLGSIAALTLDSTGEDLIGEGRVKEARRLLKKQVEKVEPFRLQLKADDRKIDGRFLIAEALIHGYAGPRLPLASGAHFGDRRLEIVLVPEDARLDFASWLHEPEKGEPPVERLSCRRLEFEWDGATPLRIDDRLQEPAKKRRPVAVALARETIDVLVPRGGDDPHATRAETKPAKVEA